MNEVLKDSDVPPIIGTGSGLWGSAECEIDGTFFYPFVSNQQVTRQPHVNCTILFSKDEILDLRAEYVKEVNTSQCGPVTLTGNWWAETRSSKDMTALSKAILSGEYLVKVPLITDFRIEFLISTRFSYLNTGFI